MDYNFGYIRDDAAIAEFIASTSTPFLSGCNQEIKGSGRGKHAQLLAYYEQVTGEKFKPNKQVNGTCVGESTSVGGETLCCVEIASGERELWKGKFSVAVVYGGSRVQIGGGRIRGDGSTGAWAAKFVNQYGYLPFGKYGGYDLTRPRPDLELEWGDDGVPAELIPLIKEHPVQNAPLCRSWDDFIDACYNGYPTIVCSNQGFESMRRDREGFIRPSGVWPHAMLLCGYVDDTRRPGAFCMNSWGDRWVSGPVHEIGNYDGGFMIDADIVDRMLRQGDSFSISGFEGFKARSLDYLLI